MQVAILSHSARAGDAIGNQIAEKVSFFLECGTEVLVFVEVDQHVHPAVRAHCRRLLAAERQGEAWEFLSGADLVIVEYSQHYRLLEFLPLLANRKPRILFDYHGVTPAPLWTGPQREALEKGARQRGLACFADLVVSHSRFMRNDLQQATGIPEQRLRVLGHPVDTTHFTAGKPRRQLRETLGLGGASLLLFVGRLAPNKRVPVLIEALGRLRDMIPAVHLALIGDAGDVYRAEAERCRGLASERHVAERVHFLGHIKEEHLVDAYRSADVFVMPSIHEGFCIPVVEAMACGVPVVAARAAALPETVGGAGLTFAPDDAEDLALQIRRALPPVRGADFQLAVQSVGKMKTCPTEPRHLRIAVVAFRFGMQVVGGAESSLRRIAGTLHEAGHDVEVFTTCTHSESEWANDLPEGSERSDGIAVHRYRLDDHERAKHLHSVRAILENGGDVSAEVEQEYLRHSIHSTALVQALEKRCDEFDAILTGPYLYGLTYDIARKFSDKAVLVPCFHDEPFARLKAWLGVYGRVGSVLYHSATEKAFAETDLGLNHPRGACIGTVLNVELQGDAERGRMRVKFSRRYIVYCGRYSVQKNVPQLIDFARRYTALHADRFGFVFMGQGEVRIPHEDWARDLGFVSAQAKHDVLAGAAAAVQLSRNESLSLAALEAWAEGTPVIVNRHCAVLDAHRQESGGGRAITGFDEFAAALDDLWARPEQWRTMGARGRSFVRDRYADRDAFRQTLEAALYGLNVPLVEHMRREGLSHAATHDRVLWRERFNRLIEDLLDAPALTRIEKVEIQPRLVERSVTVDQESVLVPVRLANRGTAPIVHEGPARRVLRAELVDESGQSITTPGMETPLPGLVLPNQGIAAVMRVPVPATTGVYQVKLSVCGVGEFTNLPVNDPDVSFRLNVVPQSGLGKNYSLAPTRRALVDDGCCTSALASVHASLAEAAGKQTLPDDYTDVTEGFLADLKRRLKRKLLGNFKHAYVDVLSRQQSNFNLHVISAIQELSECCELLDHARTASPQRHLPPKMPGEENATFLAAWIEKLVTSGKTDDVAQVMQSLLEQVANDRQTLAALDDRLKRLEEESSPKKITL